MSYLLWNVLFGNSVSEHHLESAKLLKYSSEEDFYFNELPSAGYYCKVQCN
jgi:hypothetical protein